MNGSINEGILTRLAGSTINPVQHQYVPQWALLLPLPNTNISNKEKHISDSYN